MALYPTWQRYLKLWKQVIYPIISKNINVKYVDKPTVDEEFEIATRDAVDDSKITRIINQIYDVLLNKGYDVVIWENEDCNLTIKGKDTWDPSIDISIYLTEELDELILEEYEDGRFAVFTDEPQDENGFKLDYSNWLKERGLVDTYDNILDAPVEIQEAYCDWYKSQDYTRIGVSLVYVE